MNQVSRLKVKVIEKCLSGAKLLHLSGDFNVDLAQMFTVRLIAHINQVPATKVKVT
jgi:hypothetical protein